MDDSIFDKVTSIGGFSPRAAKDQAMMIEGFYKTEEPQKIDFKDKISFDIEIERKLLDCKEMILNTFKRFLTRFLKDVSCFSHIPERLNNFKERIRSLSAKIISMKISIEHSKDRIEDLVSKAGVF
ncbi:hypothetical protein COB11_04300 [Candidatus Aerophobetes bacterium]|uniref:Uncharacterized protein n=1 Tax=Aerophobetes bacterium TaxID=2030807 RepID=A0A2A4YH37_UNCAE|nr:MAG: hypothetical protein COB11_04300 [Candidatus Aerophobetes bacterium]